MDFRDILKSFDNLSEGEKTTTDKGTVHKATAGGYGNQHGTDDVKDQYGKPIGKVSLGKLGAQNEPKRGKGRPPNPDKAKSYDSSALSKAMGMGKAPKATGKPSVKHSLKEYFDQLDQSLSEAGLSVQPIPAQKQPGQNFMIKDTSDPQAAAITTSDPAVVDAAKKGTLSMQKPGASPTNATPTTGAGSQVGAMAEDDSSDDLEWKSMVTPTASIRQLQDIFHEHNLPRDIADFLEWAHDVGAMNLGQAMKLFDHASIEDEEYGPRVDADYGADIESGYYSLQDLMTNRVDEDGEKWIQGAIKHPGAFTAKAKSHGMTPAQFRAKVLAHKENYPAKTEKQAQLTKTLSKMKEAEQPQHFAQSSPLTFEGKKGVNPFAKKDTKKKPDADHDGVPDWADKKPGKDDNEGKKKGAAPKKGVNPFAKKTEKKKVKEGMEHHLQAARLEGKSHALRKMPYNCTHDDMEEARCYHDGFKEGLDECYGQMPIMGRTAVGEMGQGPEVDTMASYGADDMGMDEGNAFTAGLAKTPHGGKFKVGGSTFTDRTRYDSNLDEFAFESLDKQLNAILEGKDVTEGMTVSISKGQQGSPDSVSVSAQDGEADQLLSIIKSSGMGLFGGDEQNGYGAPHGSTQAPGGIEVVDDHDGMMALMKKLSGGGEVSGGDYESEEGHGEEEHMHGEEGHSHEGEEEPCNECGMMECSCDHGDKEEVVDEEESEDQMMYNVAEEGAQNPPDNGSANASNATQGNAAANASLAVADAGDGAEEPVAEDDEEDTTGEESEEDDEEKVEEGIYESYANSADDTFEADIDFMTKVISGGLNKMKSTGQTTVPVIAGQKNRMGADGLGSPMKESTDLLKDYLKLSGL